MPDFPVPSCVLGERLSPVNGISNGPAPAFAVLLRKYFRSGWAFLIPYLAAYLLFFLLKWPVNPGHPTSHRLSAIGCSATGGWPVVPSLLHVYWALHAINVGLAVVAFVSWWRGRCRSVLARDLGDGDFSQKATNGTKNLEPHAPGPAPSLSFAEHIAKENAHPSPSFKLKALSFLVPRLPPSAFRLLAFRFPLSALGSTQSSTSAPHGKIICKQTPAASGFSFSAFAISRFAARFQLSAFLPWLLLALLFYIPGTFLEFPADPWEHYRRINEWLHLGFIAESIYRYKSSYFLAYSLLGWIAPPTRQLFWLDFYYTGCCLLLCWQYYRLARTIGLGERAATLFVILQSVLFGNNIFGFYRYYGISSSLFAQLGAVALVRVAIEFANQKFQSSRLKFQGNPVVTPEEDSGEMLAEDRLVSQEGTERMATRGTRRLSALRFKLKALSSTFRAAFSFRPSSRPFPRFPSFPVSRFAGLLLSAFSSALALLALIAFNHPQGLGIAALGLTAVVIWRLIEWRRSTAWWLAGAALVLSAAVVLWWPRNPALDSSYHPAGWLTSWYGFNVFSTHAEAGDRVRQIIGLFGLLNLVAALVLLRRNNVAGWLTMTPLLALCLPVVVVPFANLLASHYPGGIAVIMFPRLLLEIPAGLALVVLGTQIAGYKLQVPRTKSQGSSAEEKAHSAPSFKLKALRFMVPRLSLSAFRLPGSALWRRVSAFSFQLSAFPILLLTLTALLLVPANGPFFNRFWQALMVPPGDLAMRHVIRAADAIPANTGVDGTRFGEKALLTTPGVGFVLEASGRATLPGATRIVLKPPAPAIESKIAKLRGADLTAMQTRPFWTSEVLFTASSLNAFLSRHWLPDDVALEHANQEELFAPLPPPRFEPRPPELWLQWTRAGDPNAFYGKGFQAPLAGTFENRGSINAHKGFAPPVAGDQMTLTAVLHNAVSNIWRLSIDITGPDSFHRQKQQTQLPMPTVAESWMLCNMTVQFPRSGLYVIEIDGDLAWPSRTYKACYSLTVE